MAIASLDAAGMGMGIPTNLSAQNMKGKEGELPRNSFRLKMYWEEGYHTAGRYVVVNLNIIVKSRRCKFKSNDTNCYVATLLRLRAALRCDFSYLGGALKSEFSE